MRVVKEAEDRKNEILDAAGELFGLKGFDGTSTTDILKKVGIARGTLYYHFNSKEDIMDALIERSSSQMLSAARKIAADRHLSVAERIIGVVVSLHMSADSGCGKEMIDHMHSPQNALMHRKTQKLILSGVTPILTEIIREGIEQGLFRTPFPYECMEMTLAYAINVLDDDDTVELTAESRACRMEAFMFNVERLLGADSGSFASYLKRMFSGGN